MKFQQIADELSIGMKGYKLRYEAAVDVISEKELKISSLQANVDELRKSVGRYSSSSSNELR